MSAPQTLLRRRLTFNLQRNVQIVNGQQIAQTMEVAITPLAAPSAPAAQMTLVGGVQQQTVLLNNESNPVTFELVPSSAPGLTEPVQYLAAFREGGITGATESQPFSMPDFDTNYEDLSDLGLLLGGASFLQQSDLGIPGRVAKLNESGQVVDADGTPVTMPADLTVISGRISAETVARQQADQTNFQTLSSSITQQSTLALAQSKAYTDQSMETLTAIVGNEAGEREDADLAVQANVDTLASTVGGQISTLQTTVGGHSTALAGKADLDGTNHVPIGQIPPAAITQWVQVADTTAMRALRYPQDVQPGDLALTPTAIYGLLTTDPSQLSNWRLLNAVLSVNGRVGAVNLTASDVGAVAATDGSILITQVTGLSTALSSKAAASDVTALQSAVTTIQNDSTFVHTNSGVIANAVMPANIALISPAGNITKKDGSVVAIGEGSGVSSVNGQSGAVTLTATDVGALATGASITEAQVTGLSADLAARVLTSDSRLTNARTPTAHAASHAAAGADAITVTQGQVTGLSTALTNTGNTLSSLDTRVTTLEASGPGGYGAGTGIYFAGASPTGDFTNGVTLHSPFGFNPTNPHANVSGYYFDPAGAAGADAVMPIPSVAGVLQFRKLGIGNTPDPYYAAANDLTTLASTVSGKANSSDVATISTALAGKASASDVSALQTTVTGKANQSALDALAITVGTKAASSDLTALATTVGTKAAASDVAANTSAITGINSALATKADIVGGVLKTSQIPTNIPPGSITGLTTALTLKADLDGNGKVLLTEMPQNIPLSYIVGLITALANKADLVGGKLSTSQLPALAMNTVFTTTTQSGMLALSTAHPGDICVITSGINLGSYILAGADPTQLANWVQLQSPTSAVLSVNGQTGTVVLGAADVGALASNAVLPISQVQNLASTLATFATSSALSTAIAGVTTPSQVTTLISQSVANKQAADYVATTPIASLSGQQSVDGVTTPIGSVVLVTAQSSSVNNGLYTVNQGTWTRTSDFQAGTWLARGTVVFVTQGTNNADTVWQVTSASGVIDTNANNWRNIGNTAPPLVYSNGVGINLTGQQFSAKVATGGGLKVDSNGLAIDPASGCRKAVIAVPASATTTSTVTHNLNTNRVGCEVIETASGNMVGLGKTITGVNTISLEFGNPPNAGQYVAVVWG